MSMCCKKWPGQNPTCLTACYSHGMIPLVLRNHNSSFCSTHTCTCMHNTHAQITPTHLHTHMHTCMHTHYSNLSLLQKPTIIVQIIITDKRQCCIWIFNHLNLCIGLKLQWSLHFLRQHGWPTCVCPTATQSRICNHKQCVASFPRLYHLHIACYSPVASVVTDWTCVTVNTQHGVDLL